MTSFSLPIDTPRLLLRSFQPDDYDALCVYQPLREVQRYLEIPIRDKADVLTSLNLMRRQVSLQRPGDTLTLAIVRKHDKRLLGQVSLRWADATASQGEIRFALDPRHSGNGYASEAVRAVLDLAFDQFKIHRVSARCDGRNHRSAKLLQKLGMRLEAHYREHALFQGEWDEELHFAILDREWRRSSKVRDLPVNTPRVA